jgi:hypothetical protein
MHKTHNIKEMGEHIDQLLFAYVQEYVEMEESLLLKLIRGSKERI